MIVDIIIIRLHVTTCTTKTFVFSFYDTTDALRLVSAEQTTNSLSILAKSVSFLCLTSTVLRGPLRMVYLFLTDYTHNVTRARSVIVKFILGGVKYCIACDCQRSYLQDAKEFVRTS